MMMMMMTYMYDKTRTKVKITCDGTPQIAMWPPQLETFITV